jgi:hypothetical protein
LDLFGRPALADADFAGGFRFRHGLSLVVGQPLSPQGRRLFIPFRRIPPSEGTTEFARPRLANPAGPSGKGGGTKGADGRRLAGRVRRSAGSGRLKGHDSLLACPLMAATGAKSVGPTQWRPRRSGPRSECPAAQCRAARPRSSRWQADAEKR